MEGRKVREEKRARTERGWGEEEMKRERNRNERGGRRWEEERGG